MNKDSQCDLYKDLEYAEECYHEVLSEHLSEVSLCGDSWPGAVHDVDRAFQSVVKIRKLLGLPHTQKTCRTSEGRIYQVWAPMQEVKDYQLEDIPF